MEAPEHQPKRQRRFPKYLRKTAPISARRCARRTQYACGRVDSALAKLAWSFKPSNINPFGNMTSEYHLPFCENSILMLFCSLLSHFAIPQKLFVKLTLLSHS